MVLSSSELPVSQATFEPKILAQTPAGDYTCTDAYASIFGGPVAVTRKGDFCMRIKETLGGYDACYKVLVGPSVVECVDEFISETIVTKSPAVAIREYIQEITSYVDVQAKNKTPGQVAKVRGSVEL